MLHHYIRWTYSWYTGHTFPCNSTWLVWYLWNIILYSDSKKSTLLHVRTKVSRTFTVPESKALWEIYWSVAEQRLKEEHRWRTPPVPFFSVIINTNNYDYFFNLHCLSSHTNTPWINTLSHLKPHSHLTHLFPKLSHYLSCLCVSFWFPPLQSALTYFLLTCLWIEKKSYIKDRVKAACLFSAASQYMVL